MSEGALRVLLAGASGLVGQQLLARLLAHPQVTQVVAPGRRPLAQSSPKLLAITAAMDSAEGLRELDTTLARVAPQLDVFVSCLGSTIKQAGSKPAFLAVDRDLVVRLAQTARGLGAHHALVVSSVGASAQSGNFYLRVKGETERLLAGVGFERLDILRPGLLLGARRDSRPGEAIAQRLAPYTNPLLIGPLARYRAIPAAAVAIALERLLTASQEGQFVHESQAMSALAD